MFYPPFTSLAGIMVLDPNPAKAGKIARSISEFLDSVRTGAVRILGPAPAPLERIKRVHRQQLLIKAGTRSALHRLLGQLPGYLESRKIGATRVIVDVVSLL
jgi:primosomal protein N' (replication factor Y)